MSAPDNRDDQNRSAVVRFLAGVAEELGDLAPSVMAGGALIGGVAITLDVSLMTALTIFFGSAVLIAGIVLTNS